jgi:hypothetical protein
MPAKRRIPLYEHRPIEVGTHYFVVSITRSNVPEGYKHKGAQRYAKYHFSAIVVVVEQLAPFKPSERLRTVPYQHVFNTLEEAEARGDELEREYLDRGWHYYDERTFV